MNRKVSEKIKPETLMEAKMTKTEAVLLHAHHEKAVSLEKTIMLGKNNRQQEKSETNYEMD